MAKQSKLAKRGQVILQRAWNQGRRKGRDELKAVRETSKVITSERSFELHSENWEKFANWAEEKHNIKVVGKITEDIVKEYLQEQANKGGRDGKGAGYKTLQTYLTAINKVMIAGERWTDGDKPTLTKWKNEIEMRRDNKDIYKPLTGKEWIERNPEKYERYSNLIDVIQGFGLRIKEVQELNNYSFIKDKDGNMFVQVIGKGGKYRIAEATKEMNQKMSDMFGKIAQEVNNINEFVGKKDEAKAKDFLKNKIRNSKEHVYIPFANNHKLSRHIFRAEYAKQLLNEKFEDLKGFKTEYRGYSTIKGQELKMGDLRGYEIQIGAYKGNAQAFIEVSRNLGHNRLDVLLKYL